jgi:hypothetical protein
VSTDKEILLRWYAHDMRLMVMSCVMCDGDVADAGPDDGVVIAGA